ncbi:hypothetical protein DICPUDRAFT_81260 [Dictyostelium purpureum]|uniref:DNA ligase n=1 Tax=Dictyostelium purpureum TaxID=5786 RepID=F0ZSY6_DICPU|nr:uncharacterized protein DICPUDRAFT_81260 [Dictyostelium purpureum]EGC32964.1 hypothetical protein DICPUDRAFT_81260 [Dictyostelium purpureum]|eukprot:XP_003290530.1 hypothetical protein DICPUDRAFT_81260 [Dictyostelium purpureum]
MSEDKSGSLYSLSKLCEKLKEESTHSGKTQIISSFCKVFNGDLYLLAKLLLCKEDKRVFRMRDKVMLKICAHIWDADLDDMIADLDNGDFTETCKKFYIEYGKYPEKSTLTLKQVDDFLDSLTLSGKFDEQVKIISSLLKKCTPQDFRLICRIIDSDLKINTGAKFFLDALHPNAYDAYKKANNLHGVIEKIQKHSFESDEESDDERSSSSSSNKKKSKKSIDSDDSDNEKSSSKKKSKSKSKSFDVAIKLMTPIKPMLPKAVKDVDDVAKSSSCFYSEIKYDGERIQIHKDGNKFSCFSRNLKPLMPWKVDEVKQYIPKATKANQMILDGEVLLMDTKTGIPLPFGTLGAHKKKGFIDATVCVFLFDILYLDGKSLIHLPLEERREILEKNVTVVKHRVEFSEVTIVKGIQEKYKLTNLLNRAFKEKLEGLVIKNADSIYEPGARHWIKVKKDYIKGMADSADLIAIGGYYGSGSFGGLVTVFLMACYDKVSKRYKTVVKASGGLDDKTIDKLQPKIKETMKKISKDHTKVPDWIDINKPYTPDFIVEHPRDAMILEIESAELTKTNYHTSGYSMRFPRIVRFREDKDYKTATNLQELMELGKDAKIIPTDDIEGEFDDENLIAKRNKKKSLSITATTSTTTTTTTSSKSKDKDQQQSDNEEEDSKTKDKLFYVGGDLTQPFSGSGDTSPNIFVLNYVDNTDKWNNKGISGAISKRFPKVVESFEKIKSGESKSEKVLEENIDKEKKKIFVCNLSCIVPPKSKDESYSFSLKHFKSAIKESKGVIKNKNGSVHIAKPSFSKPSWSEIEEVLIDELYDSGIKVFVHSIKSPPSVSKTSTLSSKTTTIDVSVNNNNNNNKNENENEKTSLKRDRDQMLEHEILKELEEKELEAPVFGNVNVVFDQSVLDNQKLAKKCERLIKILGGRVSEKWCAIKGLDKTTHLICDDGESDLYHHVSRLGGAIAKTQWVEDCFNNDLLLPIDEIYCYVSKNGSSTSQNHSSKSLDTNTTKNSNAMQIDKLGESTSTSKKEEKQCKSSPSPTKKQHLLNIFSDCSIYLHENVNDRDTLKRYIVAFGGDVVDQINEKTTHLIASLPPNFSTVKPKDLFKQFLQQNKTHNKKIGNSLWLWDSINMGEVLDIKSYKLF